MTTPDRRHYADTVHAHLTTHGPQTAADIQAALGWTRRQTDNSLYTNDIFYLPTRKRLFEAGGKDWY